MDPANSNNNQQHFGVHQNNNNHSSNLTSNCHGVNNGNGTTLELQPQHQMGSKSGVERMLEFGRDLFQMSQRLEKDQGPNEANQKMLEVIIFFIYFIKNRK